MLLKHLEGVWIYYKNFYICRINHQNKTLILFYFSERIHKGKSFIGTHSIHVGMYHLFKSFDR